MKIAFQGFRGIGSRYEFLEINDLTILTGKNSSGKSTFIKLLKLLSEAFQSVKSLKDLVNIKINIATEIIGGKESLASLQKVTDAKFIFTTAFEFFIDYHEIHVKFDISNYILKVNSIEIFDKDSLEAKKPLITIYSSYINLNIKKLYPRYNKFATLYNIYEEYKCRTEEKEWNTKNEKISYKYDKIKNDLGLTDEKIKQGLRKHITTNSDGSAILELESFPEHDLDYPFKVTDFIFGGWYRILCVCNEKIEFDKQEIQSIIERSQFNDEINDFISEVKLIDPNYDFASQFLEWYEFEVCNYKVSVDTFVPDGYSEAAQIESWIMDGFFSFFKEDVEKAKYFMDPEKSIILDCGKEFFDEVQNSKFHLWYYLGKGTCLIFQKYIIKFVQALSLSKFQSNVWSLPERSFNIFNTNSIFSAFIKQWRILEKNDQKTKLSFIKNYLNKFEIADDIKVKSDSNMGFIQLLKKGNLFSVIDEGSGISNILGCLLFLAQNVKETNDENETSETPYYKKQILVFEEPESNLHPSLQSLLADLFIEVINTYRIRLIIETHSEYMIRKLQFLVAKGIVSKDSISLNYFSLTFLKKNPIIIFKRIPIADDGILQGEFGTGFFDEANNLSINLFQINQHQNN